jgi:hypothetical protein
MKQLMRWMNKVLKIKIAKIINSLKNMLKVVRLLIHKTQTLMTQN